MQTLLSRLALTNIFVAVTEQLDLLQSSVIARICESRAYAGKIVHGD